MRIERNRTLVALIGAVAFPMAALLYLSGLPGGERGSLGVVLLQVAIVVTSVGLFVVFLARLVERMNAGRVRRWLETAEGREWLDALPADERAVFLGRLDGDSPPDSDTDTNAKGEPEPEPTGADSPVDSSGPTR